MYNTSPKFSVSQHHSPIDLEDPQISESAKAWVAEESAANVIADAYEDGTRMKRYEFVQRDMEYFFHDCEPYASSGSRATATTQEVLCPLDGLDIISRICQHTELAVELGKHLRPKDLLNLYSVSKVFHLAVNAFMLSSIRMWIAHKSPEAGRIFKFNMYARYHVSDPAGRWWEDRSIGNPPASTAGHVPEASTQIRTVPGLKYLQLVVGRDRYCREIIAILSRNGHRLPPTMHGTLLRLWLLMEVSTSSQRGALLRNENLWTDHALYNAQFFFVKLVMHFNDPIYGPSSYELLHLMLGQKGLYPLWQLLMRKKFVTISELMELKVRYNFELNMAHLDISRQGGNIHGVPLKDVGKVHLEGWGTGKRHLMRPDELIPLECVNRGLEIDRHITQMMVWGYIDFSTGENLVPTEDEMYISDEEIVLANVDTSHHWQRKHALKKRWFELGPDEQEAIRMEDEDERLRALAWCGDDLDDYSSFGSRTDNGRTDNSSLGLNDEINRGYLLRPQVMETHTRPPDVQDSAGWIDFVNEALKGLSLEVGEEEALEAQAWQTYHLPEIEGDWDWDSWLQQQQDERTADLDEGDQGETW